MTPTNELLDLMRLWRNRADSYDGSILGKLTAAEIRLCASELGAALKTLEKMTDEPTEPPCKP